MAVLPPLVQKRSPNQSDRTSSTVDLVVVHDTEGGYGGAVSWLCDPRAEASAHVVLNEDGTEATQLIAWGKKAWACVAFNSVSDNLELAGYAAKPYKVAQLRVAARIVAFRLKKRGLPAKHVTPKAVGDGSRGFTYHSDLGVAGGDHHDPGFSAAQRLFFETLVKWEYMRGGFRETWGVE